MLAKECFVLDVSEQVSVREFHLGAKSGAHPQESDGEDKVPVQRRYHVTHEGEISSLAQQR